MVQNAVTAINNGTAALTQFTDPDEKAQIVALQDNPPPPSAPTTASGFNIINFLKGQNLWVGDSSSTATGNNVDTSSAGIQSLGADLSGVPNPTQ
jgi:hypothetical protein